jgi:hypothetical protein
MSHSEKILLQRECKAFSKLNSKSPISLRLDAEQELNSFIEKQLGEESSVNFLMLNQADEKTVTLFVKTEAVKTLELLRMNYTSMYIHLSPLFIDRLFEWVDTTAGGKKRSRHLYLTHFFSRYYNIDPKNVEPVETFQNYGCEVKLNQLAYSGILLKSGNNEKIHPVKETLWKTVDTLGKTLSKFSNGEDKRVDKVYDFFNTFVSDFASSMGDTDTGVKALQNSLAFLKRNKEQLSQIKNLFTSNSASSSSFMGFLFDRWSNLTKAIKQTEEAMANLENSINILLKKSSSGEIALMLHSLT